MTFSSAGPVEVPGEARCRLVAACPPGRCHIRRLRSKSRGGRFNAIALATGRAQPGLTVLKLVPTGPRLGVGVGGVWEEIERTRNVALEWPIFPSAEKNVPQTATQAQRPPPLQSPCVRRQPPQRPRTPSVPHTTSGLPRGQSFQFPRRELGTQSRDPAPSTGAIWPAHLPSVLPPSSVL